MSENDEHLKFFGSYMNAICSRWKNRASDLKFIHDNTFLLDKLPHVVSQYFSEAILSYLCQLFIPSISASSASVELAINDDPRMRKFRESAKDYWLNLTPATLSTASKCGLPVEKLLMKGDNLDSNQVKFCQVRNKFDHGEIFMSLDSTGMIVYATRNDNNINITLGLRPQDIPLIQLRTAHNFLTELYGCSQTAQLKDNKTL